MRVELKQLASISTPEPRVIRIEPFEGRRSVTLSVPSGNRGWVLTRWSRARSFACRSQSCQVNAASGEVVKQFGEEGKVRVRGARREALEAIKKAERDGGAIMEDDLRRGEGDSDDH